MSKRSDKELIDDMLNALSRMEAYCAEMDYASFLEDNKTQDAVIRNVEILGEAAKLVSEDLRQAYQEIPWRSIAGTRDRLIHHYFGVNWEIVWNIVKNDSPILIDKLNQVRFNQKRNC